MFKNVHVPYKGYWSSPFCRWQGALQNQHAVELAAATAKRFFELRGSRLIYSMVSSSARPFPKRCGFMMPPGLQR